MASWLPDDDLPRANLVAVHGLGSHGGDMKNIGEYFAERGIAVFAPDMRGFGHYSGFKGHVMKYDEYIEDMQNIVMFAKDQYSNKATFCFGSSLGGLHVIWHALTYPRSIDGILLACPAVAQNLDIGIGKLILGKILSLLNVKYYMGHELMFEDACRSPEVCERHRTDPLRFEKVTPRFGIEGLKAAKRGFELASELTLPVFYQQAGADKLISPEKSREFFDNIASKSKTWKLYEGLYHELHEEPEKEQVLQDMYEWMDTRLPT